MGPIHGKMEENMKANINMIKNTVMAFILGQMAGDMKVIGHMESKFYIIILDNMVKGNIYYLMEL